MLSIQIGSPALGTQEVVKVPVMVVLPVPVPVVLAIVEVAVRVVGDLVIERVAVDDGTLVEGTELVGGSEVWVGVMLPGDEDLPVLVIDSEIGLAVVVEGQGGLL